MAATLVVLGLGPDTETIAAAARGGIPRLDYLEIARRLRADICSFRQVAATGGRVLPWLFRARPLIGSIVSAFSRRKTYDRIFATGEDLGIPLALLLRLSRWRGRLTMIVHKCDSPRRRWMLRRVGGGMDHQFICVSRAQRRILTETLGCRPEKVTALLDGVDQAFFAADAVATSGGEDYIFSCGLENRNYALLCRAAAVLPYRFRVAASGFMSINGRADRARLVPPPNMILEKRLSFDDLRRTYALARFVVVPVYDVSYAAGVTGLLEAMAMGKAVIVTASDGIAEYVKPGVSALVVPPDDADALADAIRELWNDPARCAVMGRHNRAWVESSMALDSFCQTVASIVAGNPR